MLYKDVDGGSALENTYFGRWGHD